MKQAIPGVAPRELDEVTIMVAWPSISANPVGRFLGSLYQVSIPVFPFITLGRIFCLLSIPIALPLYFLNVLPFVARRYRLTNRRVIEERGLKFRPSRAVGLDEFDGAYLDVRSGQAWFPAADLVFTKEGGEIFRLPGVARAEGFMHACLKAQRSAAALKKLPARVLAKVS